MPEKPSALVEYLIDLSELRGASPDTDFLARLDVEPARTIFNQYKQRSGNSDQLKLVLFLLSPRPEVRPIPTPRLKARLARYEKELLQDLRSRKLPLPILIAMADLLEKVRMCLTAWEDHKRGVAFSKGGQGRLGGTNMLNVLLALIEREFRRRFGRPRHKDILGLVQIAVPGRFPPSTTIDHLRQRIRTVPVAYLNKFHPQLFP